ncbi:dihydrolipoamide acetyltransferase family protein [Enterococcus rivorum]|uniref:Dihydrolipoamide acetyltransferase component of pyruvate dehydrogenase complex n=1 Tax=Enterococcus rivorum TaxID=762845 RepID=A0A1E5KUG0_9ENTE|nr:dihydrolipoamide acetyltransferase family protein [Enterococcus rivorum]MBP2099807.1 pyruvate dehydrogenase E2 component (dihydrolipoamide acetyltransferase) [Enterococcus rivorum]OEH81535.1 acetoin dehydrogenase [Enterococcus rivorum]
MAHEILMPKLSSTMTEGTLTVWLKNEGEPVAVGDAIFEVMTDKIAIEVEAYEEGILLKRLIGDGESAPVNAVIGYIGEVGEKLPEEVQTTPIVAVVEESVVGAQAPMEVKGATEVNSIATKKVRATPAARRLAREKGLHLKDIQGSGPKGRVQVQDVAQYQPKTETATIELEETPIIPWSGMRKVIADNMVKSHTTIPAVTMHADVDMRKAKKLRADLLPMVEEDTHERLSYTELILKAVTVALQKYPQLNAHALEEGIKQYREVNLGLAVALPDGLIVPVIHQAETMGLNALTHSVKEVTKAARASTLTKKQLSGATFTISSLGKSRVNYFTPIINTPEVGILGVGGLYERLQLEKKDGQESIETIPTLPLSLTFDHRVVDGVPAADFLSLIVALLEEPMRLLL